MSKISFTEWLLRQANRGDDIGTLADDAKRHNSCPASGAGIGAWRLHLSLNHAVPEAQKALEDAWKEFKAGKQ